MVIVALAAARINATTTHITLFLSDRIRFSLRFVRCFLYEKSGASENSLAPRRFLPLSDPFFDYFGLFAAQNHVFVDNYLFYVVFRRNIVHAFEHKIFENRAESSCARL